MKKDKEIGTKIAQQLGTLISDSGKSCQNIADELQATGYRSNDKSLRKSISSWENIADIEHYPSKTEDIVALADYFGTTTDYILGRADTPVSEQDTIAISEIIGFSLEATTTLLKMSFLNGGMISELLGELLQSDKFINVMQAIKQAKDSVRKQEREIRPSDPPRLNQIRLDIAYGQIIKASRSIEAFLMEELGFNELVRNAGIGENDGK